MEKEVELKVVKDGQYVDNKVLNDDRKLSNNLQMGNIVVYKKRWFILLLSCLVQLDDQIIFLSFAPVANYTDSFYGRYSVNYFAMICTITSSVACLLAPWFGSKFGLKAVMLFPAWINTFGTVLRLCTHIRFNGNSLPIGVRFILAAMGQGLAALGTPFAVYQPPKIAAAWFPQEERALAASISATSGLLGVLVVNLVSPQVVRSVETIINLNTMMFVLTIATALLTTAGVWRSALPEHVPSESAAQDSYPFWMGMRKLIRNKAFMVLMVTMGGAIGAFTTIYALMEQILCPKGYSNETAGLLIAIGIVVGLIGAVVAGIIAGKWQIFEEIMKVTACGGAVMCVLFCILALYPDKEVYLGLCMAAFGGFGMAFYGVGMDTAAEITHPVAETTSGGMIVFSGFIQFVAVLAVVQITQRPLPESLEHLQVCSVRANTGVDIEAHDMRVPLTILSGVVCFNAVFLTLFFKPRYRRSVKPGQKLAKDPTEMTLVLQENDLKDTPDQA